jgi:hypothetical protein
MVVQRKSRFFYRGPIGLGWVENIERLFIRLFTPYEEPRILEGLSN